MRPTLLERVMTLYLIDPPGVLGCIEVPQSNEYRAKSASVSNQTWFWCRVCESLVVLRGCHKMPLFYSEIAQMFPIRIRAL